MSDSIITKITIQIELKVAVIFLHELMYLRGQKLGAYPDHLHGQGFDVPPVTMGLVEYPSMVHSMGHKHNYCLRE